jgi:hypothetical protein
MEAFSTMNLPLNTAFIMSYAFGYAVPSFSLNLRTSLIFFFISFLSQRSLSRELFTFHDYVGFLVFLSLKAGFKPWSSDKIQGII